MKLVYGKLNEMKLPVTLRGSSNTISRVMQIICWLDLEFSLFCNIPARLTVAEVTAELPCREDIFNAPTSAICWNRVLPVLSQPRSFLSGVVTTLLGGPWNEAMAQQLVCLPTSSLFTAILALGAIFWTAEVNSLGSVVSERMSAAMLRWKQAWDGHKKRIPHDSFKRLGFVKHSVELWWLGNVLLQIAREQTLVVGENGKERYRRPGSDHYIRDIISQYDGVTARSPT